MLSYFFFLCAFYVTANAGPLNLFVNVTIDDRPDIDIVEGDIAYEVGKGPDSIIGKNAYLRASKWTSGILPYIIDGASISATQAQTIRNAMQRIEQQTNNCIRFVQRTNQATWLRIYAGSGCWSYMGRTQTSGSQDVSLGSGCMHQNIIMHELLHAVGFAHEQTRPDRDQHVTINYNNIQTGTEHNFQKYTTSDVTTLNKAYDITSIMHYKSNAFSKNGQPTITSKTGLALSTIGSATEMTNLDIQKVKAYYNCP